MEAVVKDLEAKGLLEEDEGRKVMFSKRDNEIPLTIIKSDGGFTYDTSDMAAIKQRVEEEKADWVLFAHISVLWFNKISCYLFYVFYLHIGNICNRCWSIYAFSNIKTLR